MKLLWSEVENCLKLDDRYLKDLLYCSLNFHMFEISHHKSKKLPFLAMMKWQGPYLPSHFRSLEDGGKYIKQWFSDIRLTGSTGQWSLREGKTKPGEPYSCLSFTAWKVSRPQCRKKEFNRKEALQTLKG